MRRRGGLRTVGLALTGLVALLLGGDALYWHYVAGQLDDGFRAWVAAQRAAGWTVRASPPRLGGWPLAATLHITGIDLSGGDLDIPGGMRWQAERLSLRVYLLHPQRLEAIAGGTQHLRLGYGPSIPFIADRMRAEVPLPADQPPHEVTLNAANLRAGVAANGNADTLSIGKLRARLDSQPPGQTTPAVNFDLDAASLALPSRYRWALGRTIDSLRMDGMLLGPFPLVPYVTARASAWRRGGGALELRRAGLHWGPLDLSGNARLGLDERLQPAGHADLQVTGYDATLDAMAKTGVLSPSAALAAKALLSLMAQPAAQGKPAEVDVPLRLQHSTLFMQDMPLLRLPVPGLAAALKL